MGEHQPLWTEEQVTNLNDFQIYGMMHPFTCPNRDVTPHRTSRVDHGALVATVNGWRCPDCSYRQDWAHPFMLDRSWESTSNQTRQMLRTASVADAKEIDERAQVARDWIDAAFGRHIAYQWLRGIGADYLDPTLSHSEITFPEELDRNSDAFRQAFFDAIKGVAWHVANPGKLCFKDTDCPDMDWHSRDW